MFSRYDRVCALSKVLLVPLHLHHLLINSIYHPRQDRDFDVSKTCQKLCWIELRTSFVNPGS